MKTSDQVKEALEREGVNYGMVCEKTRHYERVEEMMEKFGQEIPDKPTAPDEKTRILRARLIMEEALETIEKGLGVEVTIWGLSDAYSDGTPVKFEKLKFDSAEQNPDLVEIADGCADLSVVTTGTLVACGIPDDQLLTVVDTNNLTKVENGHTDEHGKFQKHPDHKPPDVELLLTEIQVELHHRKEGE